jgi:hypothetical protein
MPKLRILPTFLKASTTDEHNSAKLALYLTS